MATSWEEVASKVQKYRDSSLSKLPEPLPAILTNLPFNVTTVPRQVLTTEQCEITETPAEVLLRSIAKGELTAIKTVEAFLMRAALAQKLVNCITELLPERAIARAKFLDDYYATHGKVIGPLHGLPISVKEHISMKGLDVNCGFVSWVGRVAEDDAHILKILSDAGCIFYVRTTEPQTLMHLETSSNLYGVTTNPFNTRLTCGGSSGGEGALLGLRGSPLGIATDIGGSIRSPAANNGLYGLKPTSYRLPMGGLMATMSGSEHIVAVVGPVSPSLDAVKLFMKVILDSKPYLQDPAMLPIPWRDNVSHLSLSGKKSLKIGIMWDDGVVKPHPPVLRALKEVAAKLSGAPEVTIVDWIPYKHDFAWEIIASLYFSDNAEDETECLESSGEPWRPLSTWIIKENKHRRPLSVRDTWQWQKKRNEYRKAYLKKWMETSTGTSPTGELEGVVDVILCPVGPGAAPPLGCSRYWGYTSQWNLLDYPALVFPVCQVDPELDVKDDSYIPLNEQDSYNHGLYNPETYRDAPVSLQLVGRRYDDEKVIEAMELIKEYVKLLS